MQKQHDYVLRTVEERGIRFIRLWFTDVLGFLKSFAITPAELEVALTEGMQFDGTSIDGFSRNQEEDMLARPDPPPHFRFSRGARRVTLPACSATSLPPTVNHSQEILAGCSNVTSGWLRNSDSASMLAPRSSISTSRTAAPTSRYSIRAVTSISLHSTWPRTTGAPPYSRSSTSGFRCRTSHHEVSPSQHELDLRHTDALAMADNLMTTRLAVKEVAMEHDIYATFMPKPLEGHDGSGLHLHLSLFEADTNAFYEKGGDLGLSKLAKGFIAGLLHHASEITALTNQWVNSYKRLVTGFDAPVYKTWSRHDQRATVRVPAPKQDAAASTRIEYRAPDPACNPYLALSVILAAGLAGIEKNYDLRPEGNPDGEPERLPASLADALDEMSNSDLVRRALGEHVFEWFLRNKYDEWKRYEQHVSTFELGNYLPVL